MNEALDPGPMRSGGNAPCAINMHGAKGFLAMFNIEADRIHHGVSTGDRIAYRVLVVNVGFNRLKARLCCTGEFLARSDVA